MVMLRLVPASGSPIEITREESLLGRDPSCEVMVADGSVSRKHARIEHRAGAWIVTDQGSANGTFLDSQRISDSPLRDERLGLKLRMFHHFASAAQATRLSPDPNVGMAGRTVQAVIDVLEKRYDGDPKKMPYIVNKEAF